MSLILVLAQDCLRQFFVELYVLLGEVCQIREHLAQVGPVLLECCEDVGDGH